MFVVEFFITFIYQPFLNVLVFLYWLLDLVSASPADMGVAVILLTLFIRFLLLPISLAGSKSEKERREIAAQLAELEERHKEDRQAYKKARKSVFGKRRGILIGEMIALVIQVSIALMLWQMFRTGLQGGDLHLIYPFMPEVNTPFNLNFLGKYDLTERNLLFNLIQSALIFILETISVLISPYKITRSEVIRLQLTLPIVSFLIFLRLPAGKMLFVITTLIFSIILTLGKYIHLKFSAYKYEKELEEARKADPNATEPLVKTIE